VTVKSRSSLVAVMKRKNLPCLAQKKERANCVRGQPEPIVLRCGSSTPPVQVLAAAGDVTGPRTTSDKAVAMEGQL